MKSKKSLLLGAAVTGLILSGSANVSAAEHASPKKGKVLCYGVNSCKGKGVCAGKVDSCSGKNGCEAKTSCAGHNSCKGKGLIQMTKEECKKKGGKVAS